MVVKEYASVNKSVSKEGDLNRRLRCRGWEVKPKTGNLSIGLYIL